MNRSKNFFALLFFLFLGVVYFHPMLSSKLIFCERDLAPFFIPPKFLWVSQVKSLVFPFWNPYNYSGIPLLATLQPGVLYPPHVFYLFLPFNVVWNWLIILHFVFAAFSTYAFLRYMKVTPLSSAVGGMVFMLSGYLLSVHNLLPHLFGVSWFPLILLYFLKYFETGEYRNSVLCALFLVFQYLAGAPEIVILTGVVLFASLFFVPWFTVRPTKLTGRAFGLVLIAGLFILLSGVQWTSFYELHKQSIRSSGLPYLQAITWSLAWKDFAQFFLPDVFGYAQNLQKYWLNQSWLKTVYLGLGPVLLALVYFVKGDKRKYFFLGLIVFSLILGLGGNTPVYKLLHKMPPFSSVRYPVKFLFLLFFAVSTVAAMGLDAVIAGLKENDRTIRRLTIAFFYLGFLFALSWAFLNFYHDQVVDFLARRNVRPPLYNEIWFNLHNAKRFLAFSFLFCTGLLLYVRLRAKRIALGFVLVVLTADLFLASYGFYGTTSWKWFEKPDGFTRELLHNTETERFMVSVKTENELNSILIGKNYLVAPYSALYGLYSIGGAEVMRIGHHEKYLGLFNCVQNIVQARSLLDVGGIKYAILSYPLTDKDFILVKKDTLNDKYVYLYEYRGYPGRFLFFPKAQFMDDEKDVMLRMINPESDFKTELIISGLQPVPRQSGNRASRGFIRLVSYRPNEVILTSESDGDGFFYVSDTYYPGWRAYVDGQETKIYRANLAFRAIEVPAGKHTIVFRYVPVSFYIGCGLTFVGILLCVWLWRKDKKSLSKQTP